MFDIRKSRLSQKGKWCFATRTMSSEFKVGDPRYVTMGHQGQPQIIEHLECGRDDFLFAPKKAQIIGQGKIFGQLSCGLC